MLSVSLSVTSATARVLYALPGRFFIVFFLKSFEHVGETLKWSVCSHRKQIIFFCVDISLSHVLDMYMPYFAFSALTCPSSAVIQLSPLPDIQPLICSVFLHLVPLPNHTLLYHQNKSSLIIFFIRFLSSIQYKSASPGTAFASYPAHTNCSAWFSHTTLQKIAVVWLFYSLIPSGTLVQATSNVSASVLPPTWSNKLFIS